VESIALAVPLLRTARKYLCLSRLSAALEALTSAGVDLIEGWQLSAAASGSPAAAGRGGGWKVPLETGATPAELINQSGYFPEMFANLYHTGEISGKLDDSLAAAAPVLPGGGLSHAQGLHADHGRDHLHRAGRRGGLLCLQLATSDA